MIVYATYQKYKKIANTKSLRQQILEFNNN